MLLGTEGRRVLRICILAILPTGSLTVVGLPYSDVSKIIKDTHER